MDGHREASGAARGARDVERGPRERVLGLEEAARYLNTSPRHLRRLYSERRIQYVKVGRRVRFLAEDLDAFLEANRVEVAP